METSTILIIAGVIIAIIIIVKRNAKKDGKWEDSAVIKERILDVLNKYSLTSSKYNTFKENRQAEVAWNKDLEKHFRKFFLNVKRGSPNKSVEIDLDIGRGKYGIELKWANRINKKKPKNNTIGQIRGYSHDGNYQNLLLVVAGTNEEKHHPYLTDIEETIGQEYNCEYYYMEIRQENKNS